MSRTITKENPTPVVGSGELPKTLFPKEEKKIIDHHLTTTSLPSSDEGDDNGTGWDNHQDK